MGCPCWLRTAPIPPAEASVSNSKGREKFGSCKTGAEDNAEFKAVKASSCKLVQMNKAFFFNKLVRGYATTAK
jgi:hypothetical protein